MKRFALLPLVGLLFLCGYHSGVIADSFSIADYYCAIEDNSPGGDNPTTACMDAIKEIYPITVPNTGQNYWGYYSDPNNPNQYGAYSMYVCYATNGSNGQSSWSFSHNDSAFSCNYWYDYSIFIRVNAIPASSGGCGAVGLAPDDDGFCAAPPPQPEPLIIPKVEGESMCPSLDTDGNPISFGSGNKYQVETDYQGFSAFPLTVRRTFNSISGEWQFLPELRPAADLSEVVVIRQDGKKLVFTSDGNGGWLSDPDITGVLTNTPTGLRYTTLSQQVEEYDSSGNVLSITQRTGLSHSFVHSASSITVTHSSSSDQLIYQLDGSGRISGFTTPDNDTYSYGYDSSDNLTGITYPDGGGTRTYHYEDSNHPNALTGITDANGDRFATWAYDAEGRATSSEHNGGAELVTIDYTNLDSATDPRVTVTNTLNKDTTYHLQEIYGVPKVVQVEGHASANCAAANMAYTYDANGFIASSTDWNGNLTSYTRNSKGQELSRTEAVGTPEERTVTTEWHPTFNAPTKITEPDRETSYTYDANGSLTNQTISERVSE